MATSGDHAEMTPAERQMRAQRVYIVSVSVGAAVFVLPCMILILLGGLEPVAETTQWLRRPAAGLAMVLILGALALLSGWGCYEALGRNVIFVPKRPIPAARQRRALRAATIFAVIGLAFGAALAVLPYMLQLWIPRLPRWTPFLGGMHLSWMLMPVGLLVGFIYGVAKVWAEAYVRSLKDDMR